MAEIVIEGLDRFQAKLNAMSAEARGRIAKDAVDEGAGVIQFYAVKNAERVFHSTQQGTLKNSIIPETHQTDTGAEALIGPQVIYGRIQELGGTILPKPENKKKLLHFVIDGHHYNAKQVTLKPHPYLRPAVENHVDQIREAMAGSILDNLEEYAE